MTTLIDLQNAAVVSALLNPGTVTNTNGSAVDLGNAEVGSTNFVLHTGAVAGEGAVKVQESDDQSSWSDLAGASWSLTPGSSVNAASVKRVQRTKRYVRAVPSGISQAITGSLLAVAQTKYVYGSSDGNTGVDKSPSS